MATKKRTPARPPAGELDLGLKVAMRRIFWGMNYATRLNLVMALPGSGRVAEELSDLDCVGFSVGGDFSVRLLIADCKSGSKVSPAARLFWLAGVRDYFGADRGYAVLLRAVPESVREQAARLGLDVLNDADRQTLENVHSDQAPPSDLFDVSGAVRLQGLTKTLPNSLDPLVRFRDHTFWHIPPERRIQRLLVELRGAAQDLDASQRGHRVLVVDLLFLLTLGLLGACRHVSATSLADPRRTLLEYLLGGSEQTRAREQGLLLAAQAIKELGGPERDTEVASLDRPSIEPEYFPELAETVARMLRRPRDAQRLLRYLEWWGQANIGLGEPAVAEVLGAAYGRYTRKMVSDIGRLAVVATGLSQDWRELVDNAGDPDQLMASQRDQGSAGDRRRRRPVEDRLTVGSEVAGLSGATSQLSLEDQSEDVEQDGVTAVHLESDGTSLVVVDRAIQLRVSLINGTDVPVRVVRAEGRSSQLGALHARSLPALPARSGRRLDFTAADTAVSESLTSIEIELDIVYEPADGNLKTIAAVLYGDDDGTYWDIETRA